MGKNIHILLTSDHGKTRGFSVPRRTVKLCMAFAVTLLLGSTVGMGLSVENIVLRNATARLARELAAVKAENQAILAEAARQEKEQKALLATALTELRQRSEVIESILDTVGVDIAIKESTSNAGGPYTDLNDESYEDLTFKVDHYLETIQSVPLGPPVKGTISSRFGRRVDPINKRPAFHDGVDIRSDLGSKITSPAAGQVVESGYTRGYGNYLVIDHGAGFVTRYLHLKKKLVKRGDTVKRGQAIGLVGNTGRSTGPHLHYAIRYRGKPINPLKFMRVATYVNRAGASR